VSDDSSLRIEIALRAGMIAKAVLEMINLEPRLVPLQINEVAKMLAELQAKVRAAK
jgi:hypothetical protein